LPFQLANYFKINIWFSGLIWEILMTIFLTRTFGEVLKQYSVSSYMSSTEPILFRGTINRTFLVAIFSNNLWVATGSTEPMLFRGTINRTFLVTIFSNNLGVATCFQLINRTFLVAQLSSVINYYIQMHLVCVQYTL